MMRNTTPFGRRPVRQVITSARPDPILLPGIGHLSIIFERLNQVHQRESTLVETLERGHIGLQLQVHNEKVVSTSENRVKPRHRLGYGLRHDVIRFLHLDPSVLYAIRRKVALKKYSAGRARPYQKIHSTEDSTAGTFNYFDTYIFSGRPLSYWCYAKLPTLNESDRKYSGSRGADPDASKAPE